MKPDQILASLSNLARQKRPVTLVAIAFFALVCVSLAGIQGWSVWKARAAQLAAATAANEAMAKSAAEHMANSLDVADLVLSELAARAQSGALVVAPIAPVAPVAPIATVAPMAAPAESGAAPGSLLAYLAERSRLAPALASLAIYNPAGEVQQAAGSFAPYPTAVRDHGHYHARVSGPALYIGAPVRSTGSGEWLLPVSRAMVGADGARAGIVLATLRLSTLRNFLQDFPVGANGAVAVLHKDSTLLLSRRANDNRIGTRLRGTPSYAVTRGADPAGSSSSHDRLSSYRRLPGYPLVTLVQQSKEEVLASWWNDAYLSTATMLVLLLVQLWVGIRLYGQIALRDRLDNERRSLQKLLVKKSRSLRELALHDALTGIANRRQFDVRMASEFTRAMHEGVSLAIVILDVDHFKRYNDQYGHPAGDECLKTVANCVSSGRRRSHDLAARMGGEEFAILLPNTGLRGAIAVAEAIRKTVAAQKMRHVPGQAHAVTVSCGVHALVPLEGMSPAELIDAADRALYLAKSSGRNCVRAEGVMPPGESKRFTLVVNK